MVKTLPGSHNIALYTSISGSTPQQNTAAARYSGNFFDCEQFFIVKTDTFLLFQLVQLHYKITDVDQKDQQPQQKVRGRVSFTKHPNTHKTV
jgi:hypothetical protein